MRSAWLLCATLALGASTADAKTLHGVVFADIDGDGVQGASEPGVGGAVVAYDVTTFVVADATGQFDLTIPDGATGNAWVRVPDGFAPGPVWTNVSAATTLAFPLAPVAKHTGPVTFVVASDVHLTSVQPFANDLAPASANATALAPPPAFFAITGDITSGGADDEFALVGSQLVHLGVPYVPVPGNHDCYYGCANYIAHYAADNYSFDVGTVHFVVWNMALSDDEIAAYLTAEQLANVDPTMTRVAMSHAPPDPATVAVLKQLGVTFVLTGHTHTNRVIDHGGLLEVNGEPFLMGGLDFTPAGYRVITIDPALGKLSAYHRATLDAPFLELMSPTLGQCVAPAGDTAFAAAEIDAAPLTVTATIDGGAPIAGVEGGGWTFTLPLPALAAGAHSLVVTATSASGATTSQTAPFQVCTRAPAPLPTHDWAQLGGSADHHNATTTALAPPLVPRWTQAVGGHVLQAAPIIANGLVIETAADLGDDTTGGVVAIDLASGAQLWRTPAHARGGAAVIGSVVVVAQVDGSVLGLDIDSGAVLWTTDLGSGERAEASYIEAAPTVDDGDVLIGNEHAFATLDPATGSATWTVDPIAKPFDFSTIDSIAVGGGLVIGSFARSTGVTAWDRDSGAVVWQTTSTETTGVNGSPVIDEAAGTVYIVDAEDDVTAYDLGTGSGAGSSSPYKWKTQLDDPLNTTWANAIAGAPALADGVLVVPTLYGDLVALETAHGQQMWRVTASPSVLRTTHYRGADMAGFEGSPLITGDIVWAADTAGNVVALDLHTSAELWRTNLGAPVLASLAVADGWLVAATFDGTVHAWSLPYGSPVSDPLEPQQAGCCDARGGSGNTALVLGALVGVVLRRRRRAG